MASKRVGWSRNNIDENLNLLFANDALPRIKLSPRCRYGHFKVDRVGQNENSNLKLAPNNYQTCVYYSLVGLLGNTIDPEGLTTARYVRQSQKIIVPKGIILKYITVKFINMFVLTS